MQLKYLLVKQHFRQVSYIVQVSSMAHGPFFQIVARNKMIDQKKSFFRSNWILFLVLVYRKTDKEIYNKPNFCTNQFHFCYHFNCRKGSLVVDYRVFTKNSPSATENMLSINQDILTGKANVTYDGKDAPVSSMSFFDSSGKAGIDINIYTCKSKLVINQIRHFLCYHILIFFKINIMGLIL